LGEVDQAARLGVGEDLVDVADVGFDRGCAWHCAEHRTASGDDLWVVVDVDYPAVDSGLADDLVGIALGGQAGPEVQKLLDAPVACHPLDRALEEPAVGPGAKDDVGYELLDLFDVRPVGLGVCAAAQGVVIDASRGWTIGYRHISHPGSPEVGDARSATSP